MSTSTTSIVAPGNSKSQGTLNSRNLRNAIGITLPPHTTYVETHGSLGATLFQKPRSKVEVLNDADGEAHNFSRIMQDRTTRERLLDAYNRSISETRLALRHTTDPVARAVSFAIAIERSAVKYPRSARSSGRAELRSCSASGARLDRVFDRMRDIQVECDSAGTILKRFDWQYALFVCDRRGVGSAQALPVETIAALNAARGKIILRIDSLPPAIRANTKWTQYPGVADAWINYSL